MTALGWIDLVLVLVAIEALAVVAYGRLMRRGPQLLPFLANLGAGLCLVLAVRVALTSGNPTLILVAVTGSLVCHLVDLAWRWSR